MLDVVVGWGIKGTDGIIEVAEEVLTERAIAHPFEEEPLKARREGWLSKEEGYSKPSSRSRSNPPSNPPSPMFIRSA
jgi:hypothetical protein